MQLDKTRIAIAERSYADILDLALQVWRAHFVSLSLALAVGIVPCAVLNHFLLAGVLADHDFDAGLVDIDDFYRVIPGHYLFLLLTLVVWQVPLATAPATLLLGQLLFFERPDARALWRDFRGSFGQLFIIQVLLRGVLVCLFVTWLVLYFVWPYLNEIILLERNPWTARNGRVSSLQRAVTMHANMAGDLVMRSLTSVVVAGLLVFALLGGLSYWRIFFVQGGLAAAICSFYLPLSIWIVVGFFTVVRFLAYLDLRIRTEGWEIELAMRAEAARLARQLT